MKSLCLLRHAKAGWKSGESSDFERSLDERGMADAPGMARLLLDHAFLPELIVASPAKRTRQTARIFADSLGYPAARISCDEKIYYEGIDGLLTVIRAFDDNLSRAMLVGHNPYLTILAEWLSGEKFANIPPCGLVSLNFPVESWLDVERGSGSLLFYDYPKA